MSTVNAQASSSKPQRKRQDHIKGKGRGGKAVQQPRLKSNQAKRQQGDEELRDLQARIDAFVRDPNPSLNGVDCIGPKQYTGDILSAAAITPYTQR